MFKYIIVAFTALVLIFTGCSDKKDEVSPKHKKSIITPSATNELRAFSEYATDKGMLKNDVLLLVRVPAQTITMITREKAIATFTVSCSKYGTGNKAGSNKTPLGLHKVCAFIGDGEPVGRVFAGRVPQKMIMPEPDWHRDSPKDYVLTRILRLEGMERGINKGRDIDSFKRFIYIHGTNEEHLLGSPASHGCIRMANKDVISLFNATKNRNTWCLIVD